MWGRDCDLDSLTLPEGSRTIVFYGAANRDPQQFPDPDRFDIRRDNAGRHVAFGAGPHMCVGMNLAKLEMRALFTRSRAGSSGSGSKKNSAC